jgi:recombination protein RecA
LIFINQIRMKIGVMFGNPETTTGGKALKFYSSVRLEVRRIETIAKGTDDAIGNKVRVKVVKNKVAPPFRKVELEIIFGKGISASASLLDAALKENLLQKSGSWYSYGEERIGQGRENAKLFIESNPDVKEEIETKLRGLLFPSLAGGTGEASAGSDKAAGEKAGSGGSDGAGKKSVKSESAAEGEEETADSELF